MYVLEIYGWQPRSIMSLRHMDGEDCNFMSLNVDDDCGIICTCMRTAFSVVYVLALWTSRNVGMSPFVMWMCV